MPQDEFVTSKTQLGASLEAGLETVSYFQEIEFYQYVRIVLPADGFVFWVRRATLTNSALYNLLAFNNVPLNQVQKIESYAPSFTVKGSLHIATNLDQTETETYSTNRVILTTQTQVKDLEEISPLFMYIAAPKNLDVRYSFSSHDNFYNASGTWHYGGAAVYSDMASQLIEDPSTFTTDNLIVSNSLPIWLSMNSAPTYPWTLPPRPKFPLYPSFTVPMNLTPPFASVHIEPENTLSLQGAPIIDSTGSHLQLAQDQVRITLYGCNNAAALDFIDFVNQFTIDNATTMGLTNIPIPMDEKRGQVELNALSQKKTIDFEVNYSQQRVRDVARQLIEQVVTTFKIAAMAA